MNVEIINAIEQLIINGSAPLIAVIFAFRGNKPPDGK